MSPELQAAIKIASACHPRLRLGQLIVNACAPMPTSKKFQAEVDPFYVSDEDLALRLMLYAA
jgi:hypothetical protein